MEVMIENIHKSYLFYGKETKKHVKIVSSMTYFIPDISMLGGL